MDRYTFLDKKSSRYFKVKIFPIKIYSGCYYREGIYPFSQKFSKNYTFLPNDRSELRPKLYLDILLYYY